MTEYFEVHERDGAARIGELRLTDAATTPALVDDVEGLDHPGVERVLADAGSRWPTERDLPSGDEDRLTILPHRGLPAGTDDRVESAFAPDYPDVDYPSAAVVSPGTAADVGADAYVLAGAPGYVGHASAFVDAIVETRRAIPADTALYLSGVATPLNVATLVYAGVDLLDPTRAIVRGTQGRYLTVEGEYDLEELTELPCACPACQRPVEEFTREDCVEHNVDALAAALRTVRERIRRGRLRDYVEGQARHEQWCTATFRRLDDEWTYLEERTPLLRRAEMTAASDDAMRRVEIRRFADRVTSRYRCRFDAPLVLVPCSARKPYSESRSHGEFHDAIRWRGHTVSITSPIGAVPQELELTYPAQHYDSVVTGRWSAEEVDFVARVLERYLDRNEYSRIVAHVPEEGYREIVERVVEARDLPVEFTVEDHPTSDESLANLAAALDGEERYMKREREHNTVRAVADYQFGEGAGDALFEGTEVRGRYPKHRVFAASDDADRGREEAEQIAALVPEYGVLALGIEGARRWADSDVPTRSVEIDDFVPHGSVLAPGIVEASPDIRVGDEVVIDGPSAFGIGRAEMSGPEMASSSRGIAVEVRHVEER